MLERDIFDKLTAWKAEKKKKALCIIGARQTGKTTTIREFAHKYYKHFVEFNFILDKNAGRIFEDGYDADTVTANITAYKLQALEPGSTLIFFDEVQECPSARTAIKALVDDGRFDYIESGSQLGVRYRQVASYAVGYEEICYMYPMSFREFAVANGVTTETLKLIDESYAEHMPLKSAVHETMLKLFYTYMVVGGMPAAVQEYCDSHDIGRVLQIQRDILELYRQDISKYSEGAEKIKIQAIFDSIPSQLDDKNRRFFLSRVDKNGRQNRYENAFLWLSDAGAAIPCYNVDEPSAPLSLAEKRNIFKLFMGDTGLLCAACMSNIQFAILHGDVNINMGGVLENVIAQSLICNGFSLHYFDSKKYGEVDFVIQNGTGTDLLEVKSGADYKKHPALNKVAAVENWNFGQKLVFCRGNVEESDGILYLPWYMAMCYRPDSLPVGSIYEIDLSGL